MATTRGALIVLAVIAVVDVGARSNVRKYTSEDLIKLRDEVSAMFHHAYDGYLQHAYPLDELRPLSCDGVDTWGSYSLTLIDALDTLAVIGNYSEFRRVYDLVAAKSNFDADINVSVFETNIRIVGGLVSAHLLAKRAGVSVAPAWPCDGPLLRLALDAATRLLPAFDTPTGMPYGTVNLRHGVPDDETPVTCTAGVGTFLVEFGALSRLTGDPVFEDTAVRAMRALWHYRSPIGLVGNHIDVLTGKWTATDAGIGAGVDSYFEYLVKGAILLQRPELMHMFKAGREGIEQYMKHDDWHFWVAMKQGTVTMPVFQSLEAFWPGLLSLVGDNMAGLKSLHNYHQVWKQYGFLPEFYNVAQGGATAKREGYPLRPELIESVMYLYRATRDPFLLTVGEDMLRSIEFSARTECGYATVKNVRDHTLEDRMESFFLAETTKYLYLLFDEDNFLHADGSTAQLLRTEHGQCVVGAGGYIFNTEAHPIDPAMLSCCHAHTEEELRHHLSTSMLSILDPGHVSDFRGDLIPARLRQIEEARAEEDRKRKQRKEEFIQRLEDLRAKEREAIQRKLQLEEMRKKRMEELEAAEAGKNISGEDGDLFNDSHTSSIELDEQKEELVEAAQCSAGEEAEVDVPPKTPNSLEFVLAYDEEDLGPTTDELGENANDVRNLSLTIEESAAMEEPHFVDDVASSDTVKEEAQSQPLMIKRQSKDETVEVLESEASKSAKPSMVDTLTDLLLKLLPAGNKPFELSEFRQRVRGGDQFGLNSSMYADHWVMSCPAQAFLERFSIHGEFFEHY